MTSQFTAQKKNCTHDYTIELKTLLHRSKDLYEELLVNLQNNDSVFLEVFNKVTIAIGNTANLAELMMEVHPDVSVRESAEHVAQEIDSLTTSLSLNQDIYKRFVRVNTDEHDDETQRMIEKTIRDFHRSGVDKDESLRKKLQKLSEQITKVGQEYSRHIRDDVKTVELPDREGLQGLPQDYIARHQPNQQGNIIITTDYPDFTPVMKYAHDATLRRELLLLFSNRAYPKNIPVLQQLLHLRHEYATLLGYQSWVEYITEDKMVNSGVRVKEFIATLHEVAKERCAKDYHQLLLEKQKVEPTATEVYEWEISYLLEKVRATECAFDSQTVRQYFEYERVTEGLLSLTSTMFGITYRQNDSVPVWHESVIVYDVYEDEQCIGRIYLDMHPREGKYKHAAQFSIANGITGVQLPEGVLVCNFPNPHTSSEPALLDIREVETYFHEFGHLLHFILSGKQRWYRLSGLSMEWDFVEAPSQLFEEWVWEYDVLKQFAKHIETGEVIPESLVQALQASDKLGKGLFIARQLVFTAFSYELYRTNPEGLDPGHLLQELQSKYYPVSMTPDTHAEANFGHLVGYSAIYYTYMWSLVIAKDLKSRFDSRHGLLDVEVAMQYRKTVLEQAGSKDASEMIEAFLGRKYSFKAFQQWLTE